MNVSVRLSDMILWNVSSSLLAELQGRVFNVTDFPTEIINCKF